MAEFKSYRKESRTDWGETREGNLCRDQVMLGAVLRIADALETIAQNYQNLINERATSINVGTRESGRKTSGIIGGTPLCAE